MTKIPLILIFISTFLSAVNAQSLNEKLRSELLKMRDSDQKARESCGKKTADEQIKCYAEIREKVDAPNTKRLGEIYEEFGFPALKTVGREGIAAFMLILQHTPDEALRQNMPKS